MVSMSRAKAVVSMSREKAVVSMNRARVVVSMSRAKGVVSMGREKGVVSVGRPLPSPLSLRLHFYLSKVGRDHMRKVTKCTNLTIPKNVIM